MARPVRFKDVVIAVGGPEDGARIYILVRERPKYVKALLILRRRVFTTVTSLRRELRMSPATVRHMLAYMTGSTGGPQLITLERIGRTTYVHLTARGYTVATATLRALKDYALTLAGVDLRRLYGIPPEQVARTLNLTTTKFGVVDWTVFVAKVSRDEPNVLMIADPVLMGAVPIRISGRSYYVLMLRDA